MLRKEWIKSDTSIGNRRTIKNKLSKETGLSGLHGDIWEAGNGKYKSIVTSLTIGRRLYFKVYGKKSERVEGDTLLCFTEKHLLDVIKALKIPKSQHTQCRYANSFSCRENY